jgi:hypothetical protein
MSTPPDPSFEPYSPRRVSFTGVRQIQGFAIKVYSIVYGDCTFSADVFEVGLLAASEELPQPVATTGRPGVGFAILHQGRTGDYVILGWWDNQNELPLRIFVRGAEGWRSATGGESVCVWDLRVVWHEREAYVVTILSGKGVRQDEAYLSWGLDGYA